MKIWPLLLIVALIPSVGGCTHPPGTYQKATIRVSSSLPCFSVADSGESRRTPPTISAISVSKFLGSKWERIWSWITPLEPETTLHPDDCISYGYRPVNDSQQQISEQLRPGERYGLSINAGIPNPSRRGDRTLGRMYGQYFCLRENSDGSQEVLLVPAFKGVTQWQLCNVPTD